MPEQLYRRVAVGQVVHWVPAVGERRCVPTRVAGIPDAPGDTLTLSVAGEPTDSARGWDAPYRGSWHFGDEVWLCAQCRA